MLSACVTISCIVAATADPTVAEPTEARLREWLNAETDRATRFELPAGVLISWTYEDYNTMSAADLAALRAEVAGKPFHPRRPALEAAEKQVRDGKSLMRLGWLRDRQGNWRFGFEAPGVVVTDTVYRTTGSWALSNGNLALFDQAIVEAGAEARQNPKSKETVFKPDLQALFFGSMSAPRQLGLPLREVRVSGSQWRATFAPETSDARIAVHIEFEGTWSDESDRGFVERLTYTRHPQTEFLGHSEVYERWTQPMGSNGPWVATAVRYVDAAGRTWRRVTGVETIELSSADVTAALAVPRHGSEDPIRGTIVLGQIADYPNGVVREVDAQTGLPGVSRPIAGMASGRQAGWRTLAGWVTLGAIGVLTALLLVNRFRRHQSKGANS